MVPEEITADQLKANAEYYRKLNQQLIQKDNIIKLLQLKLKNYEADASRGEVAAGPVGADDEARRPRRPQGEGEAEKARQATGRIAELEKLNAQLGAEVEKQREEISLRDRQIAELKARKIVSEPAPPNRDLERFKTQLAERERELEKTKEELTRLRSEPRWTPGNDPLLKEELAGAEREIAQARDEVTRLKAQVTELSSRPAPEPVRAVQEATQLPVVKAIIDLMLRADELVAHVSRDTEADPDAFSSQLSSLARMAGIERIRTVGTRFDPGLHQAVEMVYSSDHDHSTIVSEVAPGYSAAGVVVRLADVVVTLNPHYCPPCDRVAPEGSRFCHYCGGRILGREKEGVRILDEKAACQSQVEMGVAHELVGRLDQARTHFSRALAYDSGQAKALAGLARIAEAEGRFDEALGLIERLLTQGPNAQAVRSRTRLQTKLDIVNRLKDLV